MSWKGESRRHSLARRGVRTLPNNKRFVERADKKISIEQVETALYGHSMKSHTLEEVRNALNEGTPVWIVDTGTSGNDDVLIGDYDEVLTDFLFYLELDELPKDWEIYRLEMTR